MNHHVFDYVVTAVFIVVPLIGALYIARSVRGQARTLGVAGCLTWALQLVLSAVSGPIVGATFGRTRDSYLAVLGVSRLILGILWVVGFVLIVAAVCTARRPSVGPPYVGTQPPYAQPGPAVQQTSNYPFASDRPSA